MSISVHREGVNPSSMEGVLGLSDHISVGLLLWTEDDSGLPKHFFDNAMFFLNMMDSSVFSLLLEGGHTESLLLFEFSYQRPPSCLKVRGGVGWPMRF